MTKKLPRLHVYSDLHLEYRRRAEGTAANERILQEINSQLHHRRKACVILAGDIHQGVEGVKWAKQIKAPVIYTPGNHEFWDGDYKEVLQNLQNEAAGSNVHVLINDTVEIDNVIYIGLMLWTDLGTRLSWPGDYNHALRHGREIMNDYSTIRCHDWYQNEANVSRLAIELNTGYDKYIIQNEYWNGLIQVEEHNKARAYVETELRKYKDSDKHVVVVSHHPPSYKSLLGYRFKEEALYLEKKDDRFYWECIRRRMSREHDTLELLHYGSELKSLLEDTGLKSPSLWVHGHLHEPVDYVHNYTRVYSNPMRYKNDVINSIDLAEPFYASLARQVLSDDKLLNNFSKQLEEVNNVLHTLEITTQLHRDKRVDDVYYKSVLHLIEQSLRTGYDSIIEDEKQIFSRILPGVVANPKLEHYDFSELLHTVGILNLKKPALGRFGGYQPEYNTNVYPSLMIYNVHAMSSAPEEEYKEWFKEHKVQFGGDHHTHWMDELNSYRNGLINNRDVLLKWLKLLAEGKYPVFNTKSNQMFVDADEY